MTIHLNKSITKHYPVAVYFDKKAIVETMKDCINKEIAIFIDGCYYSCTIEQLEEVLKPYEKVEVCNA